jgi:hypothetical protein
MCPVCIANTALMLAGAGSTGGILAVCIGRFRRFFRANRLNAHNAFAVRLQSVSEMKGETRWQ